MRIWRFWPAVCALRNCFGDVGMARSLHGTSNLDITSLSFSQFP
jgi:hypothetical protein